MNDMSSSSNLMPVIQGNLEGIEQGIELLLAMTNEQYIHQPKPFIESSTGEHLRHILDLYRALMMTEKANVIDYDVRRRGALVESCRQTGLSELHQVKGWLESLADDPVDRKIVICSEVLLSEKKVAQAETTLLRELIFVSSHTVHHYAMMSVTAKLCDFQAPLHMGLAPTTISGLRDDKQCVQ